MAKLEFLKTVTHGWGGEGKDHKRFHAGAGDKVEVGTPELPTELANAFREKGLAAHEVVDARAAPAPDGPLPVAPTRPPGLASKIRD